MCTSLCYFRRLHIYLSLLYTVEKVVLRMFLHMCLSVCGGILFSILVGNNRVFNVVSTYIYYHITCLSPMPWIGSVCAVQSSDNHHCEWYTDECAIVTAPVFSSHRIIRIQWRVCMYMHTHGRYIESGAISRDSVMVIRDTRCKSCVAF